jgi:hypothetical protein
MKRHISTFVLLCLSVMAFAQAPQGIPYQSIVRNASGQPLANQNVRLRFTIHDSAANGNIVYQESHTTTTTPGGMLTLSIGQGAMAIGSFNAIPWGSGSKFLQVELDETGATNYTDLGTQQMMSVPYALFAEHAGEVKAKGSNPQTLLYTSDGF